MIKKQQLQLKQTVGPTHLLMAQPHMELAFKVLQLPSLELAQLVQNVVESNPLLEIVDEFSHEEEEEDIKGERDEGELLFNEDDFRHINELEEELGFDSGPNEKESSSTSTEISATSYLAQPNPPSVRLLSSIEASGWSEEDKKIAHWIAGNLEENGLLLTPVELLSQELNLPTEKIENVRRRMERLDPLGAASKSVQEFLLIQLEERGLKNSLAYRLIKDFFQPLFKRQLGEISKKLDVESELILKEIKENILSLSFHPFNFTADSPPIIPDLIIAEENNRLIVSVDDETLPTIRLSPIYEQALKESKTDKASEHYLEDHLRAAKWLLRTIAERNHILQRIGEEIAEKQADYFLNADYTLCPWTQKELAEKLNLHESTIGRAILNKWLFSPRGLHPLKFFFATSVAKTDGHTTSRQEVLDKISHLINKENKKRPLSDEKLAEQLEALGYKCARRTISKYRALLNIPSAAERTQI